MMMVSAAVNPVYGFEIFGWRPFGGTDETVPEGALAYEVNLVVAPAHEALEERLRRASSLIALRERGAADLMALAGRAQADRSRLIAALYSEGRYGGTVDIRIGGSTLEAIRAAPGISAPGRTVRVDIRVEPGPVFRFGPLSIVQPDNIPDAPSSNPADYGLSRGARARADTIVDAGETLIRAWRRVGHPFAEISERRVQANHADNTVSVRLTVTPGPKANFGPVTIEGTDRMNPEFVRRQADIVEGERYTPEALETARSRLQRLGVFRMTRISHAEALDASGALPLVVSVEEQERRFIGASAGWSSVEGGEVQGYWGHRNLFGEAERLRVDAGVSRIGDASVENFEYRLLSTFVKPGILDIDTDLLARVGFARQRPDPYESIGGTAFVGLAHRFDDHLSGQAGVEVRSSWIDDAFGSRRFRLFGLPAAIAYDTRDNLLDPASGMRAAVTLSPYVDVNRGNVFAVGRFDGSIYRALDSDARVVAAGRFAYGSIVGASVADIPPDLRFFAGGGGSVRGYAYRNIGPRLDGTVTGGRNIMEASGELRLRLTENFGLVPFLDTGAVSSSAFPGNNIKFKAGGGLGFRYYTMVGPIRLDVAFPFSPERGDPDFAIYLGLGQAF